MSAIIKKQAASATNKIDRQIRRAKEVLRELGAALENLEDHRAVVAAEARNAGKPGVSLRDAAKELVL